MRFKEFILNENTAYLGQRISDILNAIHDLNQNAEGMGPRQLASQGEGVVNQIRRILHTHWDQKEKKYLPSLQKAGVAIMKSIEEKGDLKNVLQGASGELEEIVNKMGTPQNRLATMPETDSKNQTSPSQGEDAPSDSSASQQNPQQNSQPPSNVANSPAQGPQTPGVQEPQPAMDSTLPVAPAG